MARRVARASACGVWPCKDQNPQAEAYATKNLNFGKGDGCYGKDVAAAAFLDEYNGVQIGAVPFACRVNGKGRGESGCRGVNFSEGQKLTGDAVVFECAARIFTVLHV